MIKDRGKRTSAAMPGIFLYWPNPPDIVGAVTPGASEVISLLLVRILQGSFFKNNNNNNDSDSNNYPGRAFIQSEQWLGYLNQWLGLCRRRRLLTWMREKKMMMIQTIVYGYVFFFIVSGQIFWVAILFCLNAWGLELCVVLGCLWILVVLYVCSFHLQMRGNPGGYVRGLLLA